MPKENHGSSRDGTSPRFALSDLLFSLYWFQVTLEPQQDSSQDLASLIPFLQSLSPKAALNPQAPRRTGQSSIPTRLPKNQFFLVTFANIMYSM